MSNEKLRNVMAMFRPTGVPKPPPEPMPMPDVRIRLPMRDGIRLDTCVWLPTSEADSASTRVPAILMRTPYKESVLGFKRLGVLQYVEAGYALVIQQVRGIGRSEGHFSFNAPHDRTDGYDTVEWIAAEPWCDGNVGMDGSSYGAMTQLTAAVLRPPHLRCIVPAVPAMNFFREVPYVGGIFSRVHTINWARILQIDSLNELTAGFLSSMPILANAEALTRMTIRPASGAAEGELEGDFLQHYRDVLAHSTYDIWFQERSIDSDDLAEIDIPTLVVNGNFDAGIGAMSLWKGLEECAGNAAERRLLIGPWDHGQCYVGGEPSHGPYSMGEASVLDLHALRIAFFDRHLKGRGQGFAFGDRAEDRVKIFITGANCWHTFDRFPPAQIESRKWFLSSDGHANSHRGDGRLRPLPPSGDEASDSFVDDPAWPFVGSISAAMESTLEFDLRERERDHETLVYDTGPLKGPLTILGEGQADLYVAADAPDADIVIFLAEHHADGRTIRLAWGQLRLRYRNGFQAECNLIPGETVRVSIPLTYIGHLVPAGSSLRLLVAGSNFPLADPNPHTGEPVGSAVSMRAAVQTLFHDSGRPSSLTLPLMPFNPTTPSPRPAAPCAPAPTPG